MLYTCYARHYAPEAERTFMINFEDKQILDHFEHRINAAKLLCDISARHIDNKISQINNLIREQTDVTHLSLWRESAASRNEIISYVRVATDPNSPHYIPPHNRIAVTDMDGTIFCETDPTYFDFRLLLYRVLEDETYKDKASEQEREVVKKIQYFIDTGISSQGMVMDAGQAIASSFAGMTVSEFEQYVARFAETPAPGYNGMKSGEAFYKPMLQLLDFLKFFGFSVYVCSGTDRMVIRGIVNDVNITPNRVIGTDERLVARDQGNAGDIDYCYDNHDELILSGQMTNKNLQMSKVSLIAQEIGYQPVLCFGNSSDDISMARYVTVNNPYPSRVFMLCCDDTERENGNPEKAAKMRALCEENGWIPVSMKNDWNTIYGDGVTRKKT